MVTKKWHFLLVPKLSLQKFCALLCFVTHCLSRARSSSSRESPSSSAQVKLTVLHNATQIRGQMWRDNMWKMWPLTSPLGWRQVDKQILLYSWRQHRVHLWHELKSRRVPLICGTLSCGSQAPLSFLCIFTELEGSGVAGETRESKPLAF